jgi:hypothetical protein
MMWVGLATAAAAQDILVVEHATRLKRYRIALGDQIELRWRGESSFRRVKLVGLRPDTLLCTSRDGSSEFVIPLEEVEAFRLGGRQRTGTNLPSLLGTTAVAAGAGLLIVRTVNGLSQDLRPVLPSSFLLLSGGLIAGGVVIQRLSGPRRLTLGKRWQAKTLDLGLVPKGDR